MDNSKKSYGPNTFLSTAPLETFQQLSTGAVEQNKRANCPQDNLLIIHRSCGKILGYKKNTSLRGPKGRGNPVTCSASRIGAYFYPRDCHGLRPRNDVVFFVRSTTDYRQELILAVMSRILSESCWLPPLRATSILRMECRTVEWSRENSWPMSGRDRLVSWRIRYMAI